MQIKYIVGVLATLTVAACSDNTKTTADAAIEDDAAIDGPANDTGDQDAEPDKKVTPDLQVGTSWGKALGGTKTDEGKAIAIDAQGNIYLVGSFSDSVDFGDGDKQSSGETDIFLASYDASGTFRWAKTFGGSAADEGYGVAVAGDTVVLAAGFESDQLTVGDETLKLKGDMDMLLATFDLQGAPRWAKALGGTDTDVPQDVAIDNEGRIALTGFFIDECDLNGKTVSSTGPFDVDIFVASFDSTGAPRWVERYGNGLYDRGRGVAIDSKGGVIIAGEFISDVDFGGGFLEGHGQTDAFVAAYDVDGTHRWSKHYGGGGYDAARSVAVDDDGNVVAAGSFADAVAFGAETLSAKGTYDAFLIRLDNSGQEQWVRAVSSDSPDRSFGVAIDAASNAFVAGAFRETAAFTGGELTSAGRSDAFLISYDPAGTLLSAEQLGGAESDEGSAVAVGPSAEVATTGFFSESIKLQGQDVTSAGSRDVFIWRVLK